MLLDVESGQVVELTLGCAEPQRYLGATTFWRQGRELVYTCASETERRQLKTYDLRSGETVLLAELEQPASRLQVAPDGERLWATSTRLGETWIRRQFVVDADGAVREMVLRPGWNIVDWSSDGRLVVTRDADAERLFGYVDPGSDDPAVDVVVRGRNR
jgi:Tol biopolymer transport system component